MRRLDEVLRRQNPQELTARIYALEQRLAKLEKAAQTATPSVTATAIAVPEAKPSEPPPVPQSPPTPMASMPPPLPPAPPVPAKPREVAPSFSGSGFAPPPLHTSQGRATDTNDLETVIGGRWLNRIAIVALLVGFSFGLKYAFDNNWIGPSGRVAIGILIGALMMPWSSWLLGRGYPYFSEGIVALGEATLFLSVWAGCQYYTLYSRDVGFFGMILITAAMAAISLGRDSQRIAVLCLLGGYATPMLVSTGQDHQIVLFTYLLILGAGMLVMGERKDWYSLAPISFIGTQLYFWGWFEEFYHRTSSPPLERTTLFATLFFCFLPRCPSFARSKKECSQKSTSLLLRLTRSFMSARCTRSSGRTTAGPSHCSFWRWPRVTSPSRESFPA